MAELLIQHLKTLLGDEFKLLVGVGQQVEDIKKDLEKMTDFLKDAETRPDTEEGLKERVKHIRELAFRIEDVLDEYVLDDFNLQIEEPHHPPAGFIGFFHKFTCFCFIGFFHKFTCFFKQLKARHQIATEIQHIKPLIGDIKDMEAKFSFSASTPNPSSSSSILIDPRGLSSLYVKESELVGIDTIRNELMKRLTDGESSLTVISVFGEGGIGKTTLVRKVYESQGVKARFNWYAWITVSQPFDDEKILKGLIKQHCKIRKEFLPEGMDTMHYEELVETLREYLAEKRYVVILDDIWGLEVWPRLKCAFPENEESSRIIITTRNHQVASLCTDSHKNVYPFLPLNPLDAWDLFCKKAFGLNNGGTCPPHFDGLCKNIVKRCGGLPLAIVAIGGLLSKKRMILSEWELVYRSLGTEIAINDTIKSMKKILWLSYHDLPYHLKSCFLYFSHFPEDYTMKRARLTRMWVAEGFIKPDRENKRTLDEIGEAYLDELVDRSLIQVSKVGFYGRVERCRVHDLIRELILEKTVEENFCMSLTEENTGLHDQTRRLSIYNGENVVFLEDDCRFLRGVRSLFMLQVSNNPALLSSFRLLKVLTLKGRRLDRFPSEIVNMFHLRYLNMRRTFIREIPNSIGKLQNLQTLDLKHTYVWNLPKGILKLKKLRHLLVEIYLHDGVRLPTGIGHLICLEKLSLIDVMEKNREVVKELGKLRQLRKLGIKIKRLRGEDVESLFDSISNMKKLKSLYIGSISSGGEHLDVSFLSKYSLPLPRSIQLEVSLLNLTNLLPLFQNLVKLKLQWSGLRDDPLKSLHDLPYLAFLSLSWFVYKGEELSCESGGFPSLKVLHIDGLDRLRCVRFEEGAMPLLEELYITRCISLEELPIGIEHLTSLKDLDVWKNSAKLDEIVMGSEGKIGPHQMDINAMSWRERTGRRKPPKLTFNG